jgi:hypothetical protein
MKALRQRYRLPGDALFRAFSSLRAAACMTPPAPGKTRRSYVRYRTALPGGSADDVCEGKPKPAVQSGIGLDEHGEYICD